MRRAASCTYPDRDPSIWRARCCPGSFQDEAELTFRNLNALATAAGADLRDTVRVGVYLSTMENFAELGEIVPRYFGALMPARTAIPFALNGFQIDVDAIVGER